MNAEVGEFGVYWDSGTLGDPNSAAYCLFPLFLVYVLFGECFHVKILNFGP